MIINPYKLGSRSAKRIKEAINQVHDRKVCWVLQRQPRGRALIVNWGNGNILYPEGQNWIINAPADVRDMSDKISFFKRLNNDDICLRWTVDHATAKEWGNASKVFVRTLTRGSGGRGIHVWEAAGGEPLPNAPLYTRHQAKTHEYRVHMARSLTGSDFEPLLVQRKVWVKKDGQQPKSWDVRSHDNGFIFQTQRETEKVPERVLGVARRTMGKYFPDMHFAALDVLYHKPSDVAVVCEGNTAPGVENNTVDVYAHYFRGLMEEFKNERTVRL